MRTLLGEPHSGCLHPHSSVLWGTITISMLLMRKAGHLQALSYGVAELLPVSPLLGASNQHPSPLWRTWGQRGLQVKRHSVLSSLLRLKCHKTGLTLLEGSVKGIAPDRSVSSHRPLRSDEQMTSLSTSWVTPIIETRLAEWKPHCVWKQRRRKQDATCDTPTSTLWDFGEFLRLD